MDFDFKPTTDPLRGFLYVSGGWLCVGLAVIGAVLPLLPTTPFLLLASWCFYRGSPRIHAWLHRSKWFGPTLDDWQHYRGIRRNSKRRTILLVLAVVTASLLLNSLPWWLRYVVLVAVAVGLSVIWTIPTLPDDAPRAPRTTAE
ncbi:MAG: YbaN family protein [Planctomycetaceae bacterium]